MLAKAVVASVCPFTEVTQYIERVKDLVKSMSPLAMNFLSGYHCTSTSFCLKFSDFLIKECALCGTQDLFFF